MSARKTPSSSPAPERPKAAKTAKAAKAAKAGKAQTDAAGASGRRVDPALLEMLVCPLTKGPLRYDREARELISEKAELAYPIRDGIPIMLPEEARELTDE